MKTRIIAATLAASLALSSSVQAAEVTRMSADQVRAATLSSQSGPIGSSRTEIIVLVLLAIVAIAITISVSSGGGSYAAMASDERLKTDIRRVGTSPQGFGIYEFRYKGQAQRIRGAMAQDVARLRPEAVSRHESGYLMVDYNRIDVRPALID